MPSAPQTQFFPPCILVVCTALTLALVGWWSYNFVQTPAGASFTPAASTTSGFATTLAPAATPPPPPMMISLRVPACPRALCEARATVLSACAADGSDAATYCILDEATPVCSVGQCHVAFAHAHVVALASTQFQCDCRCDDGARAIVSNSRLE